MEFNMSQFDRIWLQYHQTLQNADELEELGNELIRVADHEMNEVHQSLRNSWKGDAGEFYSRYQEIEAKRIREHGKKLQRTAAILRAAAQRVRDADLFAAAITGR